MPGSEHDPTGGPARTRTQAARDAATVEIAYAVLTGALFAAAAFLAVAAPALLGAAHGAARGHWLAAAAGVGAGVFCLWAGRVLLRFDRGARERGGAAGPQPSQPGRTRPDS